MALHKQQYGSEEWVSIVERLSNREDERLMWVIFLGWWVVGGWASPEERRCGAVEVCWLCGCEREAYQLIRMISSLHINKAPQAERAGQERE